MAATDESDSPNPVELSVPVLLEDGNHVDGLLHLVEVREVVVGEGVSPALPDLPVLPPPGQLGQERGRLVRGRFPLQTTNNKQSKTATAIA